MTARLGRIGVAVVLLAACGGSSKTAEGTQTAACDWTAVATDRRCQQATGPAADIQAGLASCATASPAGVLRATCPSTGGTGLVGCCSYPAYGLAMSWCYYDASLYSTIEGSCHALTVNGDPAVWTTTVPVP